MIGRTLGHYRIVEPLGAGGMGEVFLAHDEKLDRDVALKVLPEGALSDEEARKRFQREANALSRLSHPHIATILDFDTAEGVDFLVMELVRGPSLADELQVKGALPEKTAVRLGAQIARGLQAAHEQGVVHRDLKPSNLQLTPDGMVKILDFGLARLVSAESPGAGETAPTQTAVGRVVGTLPYMSPEQLRGRGVDARADLYALGAVLYELVTGRRLFSKPSAAELTEAILSEDPTPPRAVNDRISPTLEAVILKTLDKDPELRHQTAKELLVDLERLQQRPDSRSSGSGPVETSAHTAARPRRARRWMLVGLAAAIGVLAGGAWLLRPPPPPRITGIRALHVDVGPEFGSPYYPTWVTDGVRIYFNARKEDGSLGLYQIALGGGDPVEIPTPFSSLEVHGYLPRQAALVALGRHASAPPPDVLSGAGPVWLVPVPEGPARRLGGLRANWVAVSPDGEQLALLRERRLLLARTDGSDVRQLWELPERSAASWIQWSPDGQRLRFVGSGPPGRETERWIWETSPGGRDPQPLWPGGRGEWTRDGRYFLFESWNASARRTDVFAVSERGRLPWTRSVPVQLTHGPVDLTRIGSQPDGHGLLAFGVERRGEPRVFDRRARRFEPILAGEPVDIVVPSPDGDWLAWVTYPEGTLWRGRRDGSERHQLTNSPERAWQPSWSPDGRRIAFVGDHPNAPGWSVRLVSADGGAVETLQLAASGSSYWDPCWLADGRTVVFSERSNARPGIHRVDVETKTVELFDGAEELLYPKCGPRGQVLAVRGSSGGPFTLYRPERGSWEELDTATFGFATWTRDGQAFCGLTLDQSQIRCYFPATGRAEALMDLSDTPLLFGTAGWPWVGLDAEDNPLVILDRSTRDFYALDWEAP